MEKYFFDKLEEYGEKTALLSEDGRVFTYHDIIITSQKFSSLIEARSLTFILCTNTPASIMGYVGCLRSRSVPVMLDAGIDSCLLRQLISIYMPKYIYQPEARESSEYPSPKAASCIYKENGYCLYLLGTKPQYPIYDGLALLMTTSGSTGSPKLVRQSYENIQANAEAICEYLDIDDTERAVTSLPMHYTYGLSVIHTHLLKGASIVVTDHPVIRKEFWALVKKEGITSLSGVPYTYEVLKKLHFTDMQLPGLKTLTQAGGKLPAALHKEFAEYAKRTNKQFVVMYGQTEATARMSWLPSHKSLEKCGSIGIPIPGGRFSIIDASGMEITQPGTEGELVYHGRNVTLGYAERSGDLLKENELHYTLHTGDMAKCDEDGYYYITGRKKRFLKLYGSRVNLDEIDNLIQGNYPEIECASIGSDEKMLIYICSPEPLPTEIKRFIVNTTHINTSAVEVRYIPEIPRSPSGKIQYSQLQEEA